MDKVILLLVSVFIALMLLGCTSGMRSPPICKTLCAPGQTQMPYPDCRCIGEPFGGGIGPAPSLTPISGGGIIVQPSPSPTDEGTLAPGGLAELGPNEGLILVTLRAEPMGSVEDVIIRIKEIDGYRTAPDSGWVLLSGSRKSYDFSLMKGREYPAAVARAGIGRYVYLRIVFDGDIIVRRAGRTEEVSTSEDMMLLMKLPVSRSATSAVRLSFDLDRCFIEDEEGNLSFTPHLTIETWQGVRYIVKDDGSIEIDGEKVLEEEVSFSQTFVARYQVIGGNEATCVSSCVQECGDRNMTVSCHDACIRGC